MNLSLELTAKEAEALYLGVELRTAAAGMAMTRIRQLHPQFEG
jgi:hypothetical protein